MLHANEPMGRTQLLAWLNELTGLNYTKVEQCCSGAAISQIFHSLFPEDINLRRINFKARLEYERMQNFKVLQGMFKRLHIDKHIPIERLLKGKYQDNLEFLQWVKGFYDRHCNCNEGVEEYDGAAVRRELGINAGVVGNGKKLGRSKTVAGGRMGAAGFRNGNVQRNGPGRRVGTAKNVVGVGAKRGTFKGKENLQNGMRRTKGSGMSMAEKKELEELRASVQDMDITVKDLERERDFYFGKLRDVEILIQTHENENPDTPLDGVLGTIQTVLYATEEEDDALKEGGDPAEQEETEEVYVDENDHGLVPEQEVDDGYDDSAIVSTHDPEQYEEQLLEEPLPAEAVGA